MIAVVCGITSPFRPKNLEYFIGEGHSSHIEDAMWHFYKFRDLPPTEWTRGAIAPLVPKTSNLRSCLIGHVIGDDGRIFCISSREVIS